jgi:hypothetical protein
MNFPFIASPEQACDLAQKNHDHFYLEAFRLQVWLNSVTVESVCDYADIPNPANRRMQTGQAWRAFNFILQPVTDEVLPLLIDSLVRLSNYDNPFSINLLKALGPVYHEHDLTGEFLGPKSPPCTNEPAKAFNLMRRSIQRMCEWLDAVIHLQTHDVWFDYPDCFHPDFEKRQLAALELSQPFVAQMKDTTFTRPYLKSPSSARFEVPDATPKRTPPRTWPFPKFDEIVISLWPLLKLHHWSASEMLGAVAFAHLPAAAYACQDPDDLVDYCANSLGLHQPPVDHPDRQLDTPGYQFAKLFLNPPHRKPKIGEGPWS